MIYVLPCMLDGVKNGIFNIARIFSVNHISSGSPGVMSLIVFSITPSAVVIKSALQSWQSFANSTIFNQQEVLTSPSTQIRRPSASTISTYNQLTRLKKFARIRFPISRTYFDIANCIYNTYILYSRYNILRQFFHINDLRWRIFSNGSSSSDDRSV